MLDIDVIEDPAAAAIALDPVRSRLLAELATPASAANLAERIGVPRQKISLRCVQDLRADAARAHSRISIDASMEANSES